jgi:hypothetical protein
LSVPPNFADAVVGAIVAQAANQAGLAVVTGIAAGLGVVVSLPVTASIATLAAVIGVITAFTLANFARGGDEPDEPPPPGGGMIP